MTKKEMEHLSELSKLEFNEKDLAKFDKEFESILEFVSQVEKANIEGEMTIAKVAFGSLREDEVRKSLEREKTLKNAPKSDGEFFVVPQVVE